MTICHAKQEDEKELVFKFGFIGGFPRFLPAPAGKVAPKAADEESKMGFSYGFKKNP